MISKMFLKSLVFREDTAKTFKCLEKCKNLSDY